MPNARKRTTRNQSRFIVNDELIRAIKAGDYEKGRKLLGLKPWEFDYGFKPLMIPEGPEFNELINEIETRLKNGDK